MIESGLTKLSLSQSGQDKTEVSRIDDTSIYLKATAPKLHEYSSKSHTRKRHIGTAEKIVKKNKVQSASGVVRAHVIKQHTIEPPDYFIKCDRGDEYMEVDLLKFVPPSKDARLFQTVGKSLTDITGIKVSI